MPLCVTEVCTSKSQVYVAFTVSRTAADAVFCNCSYLALESMCLLAASEFSHDAVKKHQDTVIAALKVCCQDVVNFSCDLVTWR